jgi:hypothetical protein
MIIQKKIPQNNEKFFLGIFFVYGSLDRINAVTREKQINKKWEKQIKEIINRKKKSSYCQIFDSYCQFLDSYCQFLPNLYQKQVILSDT